MVSGMIRTLQAGFLQHPVGSFLILHGLGGRTASILAARLAGFNMAVYLPLAIVLDMIQVPLFFLLYEGSGKRVLFLKRMGEWFQRKREGWAGSPFHQRLILLGQLGVVVMTLLPIKGGGMWSGVLLAHLLRLDRRRSYLLLLAGSVLGGLLLVGLSDLMLRFWHLLQRG
jgi:uncharacterized membrane protein